MKAHHFLNTFFIYHLVQWHLCIYSKKKKRSYTVSCKHRRAYSLDEWINTCIYVLYILYSRVYMSTGLMCGRLVWCTFIVYCSCELVTLLVCCLFARSHDPIQPHKLVSACAQHLFKIIFLFRLCQHCSACRNFEKLYILCDQNLN
jgi:hypothetical protein